FSSTARAALDRGTRCSRRAFIRSAGTTQIQPSVVLADLAPTGADDFIGAPGSQDQELQRARLNIIALAQPLQEGRDVAIGQRRVMLDARQLLAGGQQMVEVTAPACGVLAVAIAVDPRPVEYVFNPAAQA